MEVQRRGAVGGERDRVSLGQSRDLHEPGDTAAAGRVRLQMSTAPVSSMRRNRRGRIHTHRNLRGRGTQSRSRRKPRRPILRTQSNRPLICGAESIRPPDCRSSSSAIERAGAAKRRLRENSCCYCCCWVCPCSAQNVSTCWRSIAPVTVWSKRPPLGYSGAASSVASSTGSTKLSLPGVT